MESKRLLSLLICLLIVASSVFTGCRRIDNSTPIDSTEFLSDTSYEESELSTAPASEESTDTSSVSDEITDTPEITKKDEETKAPEVTKAPETTEKTPVTSSPETEAPKPPSDVPEEFKNHVLLKPKNVGYCNQFKGKVHFTFIFVNDSESSFTNEDISNYKSEISDQINKIKSDASSYGVSLTISSEYKNATIKTRVGKSDESLDWMKDALSSAGLSSYNKFNNDLKKAKGVDEATVVFIANKNDRAYAVQQKDTVGPECAVLFNKLTALRHEIYHVFGASDYYVMEAIDTAASTYFDKSVMQNSKTGTVDQFTAYAMGWTKEPGAKAVEFLRTTKYITQAQIDFARKEQESSGYGIIIYSDGKYEGERTNGEPDGEGTMIWDDGSKYIGSWKMGDFHGEGSMVWYDGSSYIGSWQNDMKHGKGKYTWNNGDVYEGEFVNDKRHGYGVFTRADGSVYKGNWSENNRSGEGSMTWASGTTYTGYWKDNLMHGEGTMTYPSGKILTGKWENDVYIGA